MTEIHFSCFGLTSQPGHSFEYFYWIFLPLRTAFHHLLASFSRRNDRRQFDLRDRCFHFVSKFLQASLQRQEKEHDERGVRRGGKKYRSSAASWGSVFFLKTQLPPCLATAVRQKNGKAIFWRFVPRHSTPSCALTLDTGFYLVFFPILVIHTALSDARRRRLTIMLKFMQLIDFCNKILVQSI